jgi:hypothetical protein
LKSAAILFLTNKRKRGYWRRLIKGIMEECSQLTLLCEKWELWIVMFRKQVQILQGSKSVRAHIWWIEISQALRLRIWAQVLIWEVTSSVSISIATWNPRTVPLRTLSAQWVVQWAALQARTANPLTLSKAREKNLATMLLKSVQLQS